MKINYPEELLPQPIYRQDIFEDQSSKGKPTLKVDDLKSFYLVHTLDDGKSLHSSYQLSVNFREYFTPRRFVSGMSMNLLSVYRKRHTQYIVNYKSNNGASDPWKLGEVSIIPRKKLKKKKSAGYFGMKIADIMSIQKKLPMKNNEGASEDEFLISTVIEHKPSRCNYWHFEIYLYAKDLDKPNESYCGKMTDLAAKKIISNNQVKVVPGKMLQEFKKIAKMRSELIEFHIPKEFYLN